MPPAPLTLRRYAPAELGPLQDIVRLCGEILRRERSLTHWDPGPPISVMQQQAATRVVYGVEFAGSPIATFTYGHEGWSSSPAWSAPDAASVYVSRLAILPSWRRQGVGRWCMQTVEAVARCEGKSCVRLDTVADDGFAADFYRRLGYHDCGQASWTDWHGTPRTLRLFDRLLCTTAPCTPPSASARCRTPDAPHRYDTHGDA